MMNGRHMVFTNGLVKNGKITPTAAEAFADAKRITTPEFVSRILEFKDGGRFLEACARSLDMIIDRIRTVRESYMDEKRKANERGETGLMFELDQEWWGCRPEEDPCDESRHPLRSKAERMIADTLFAIYERSGGNMDHQKWKGIVGRIKEDLFKSIEEPIAETEQANANFLYITTNEKELVERIWDAGFEHAERMVLAEERKPSPKRATAAS